MWLLYQLLYGLLLVLAGPFLLLIRGRHYLASFKGRLGALAPRTPGSDARGRPIWIHAVSVGEVGVAASVAALAPAGLPIVATTITPTGQERAQAQLARATVTYLPFEFGFAIKRFFDRFHPRALILCEGDYWPLILRAARRRDLPVAVVNGRVSDRSFRRMRLLRPLLKPLFSPVTAFGVQTLEDRQRLIALGVAKEKISVTGNLKFDMTEPTLSSELEGSITRLASGRPIIVAGSTMRGEEELVLEAFSRAGGASKALLILAPRHPERCDRVAIRLERAGLKYLRRSKLSGRDDGSDGEIEVLLLDTLGELAGLYKLAAMVFIGGTLVSSGGHNPLEAARFGVPIAVGRSMDNFREIAARFESQNAWKQVPDSTSLAEVWTSWLEHPDERAGIGARGLGVFEDSGGALEKTRELLEQRLNIWQGH